MKRVLIGGIFSLIGSIWTLAVILKAESHVVSSWHSSLGRFFTALEEMDMVLMFLFSDLLLILGLVILVIEYFKKGA